eukprot:GFUD01003632.1.p1 GENE.GFUD01003632.1~~GFUD01003632.1.p1  ORF type:complete len:609 (+),score=165.52 GFUD01003632.1:55-1881(+)
MGIRGLQSFLEKECPGGFYEVKIAELAAAHKYSTGSQPIVVVDTMSCINMIYITSGLDWVCGGQFKEYVEAWGHFIESFLRLGIRLVFVLDGSSQVAKRQEWVRRRYETMTNKVYPTFDCLKRGVLPNNMEDRFCLPNLQTKHILKTVFNCEVITSEKEADEEIVILANELNAMGILGQDSDYVIYQTRVPYLSSQHLNLKTLTTMVYDRNKFAHYIGIQVSQLPIFAVLAGNDIISRDDLYEFHRWVSSHCGKGRPTFGVIACSIGQFIVQENFPCTKDQILNIVTKMAHEIFNDIEKTEEIKSVIMGYYLQSEEPKSTKFSSQDKNWSEILAMFKKEYLNSESPSVFPIMVGKSFESPTALEDFRSSHILPPHILLWESARLRMYSILLHEMPGARDQDGNFLHQVEEWCMTGPESLDSPTFQTPAVLDKEISHPGLIQLHRTRDRSMQELRWKLFAWTIHPSLDPDKLLTLEPGKVLLVSTLFYIQHEPSQPVLEEWEAKLFILQHILLNRRTCKEVCQSVKSAPIPTARGAGLATLFTKTVVPHINYVVGSPCTLSMMLNHKNFDGKLFQSLYNRALDGEDMLALCGGVGDLLEEVQIVYNLVL